MSRNEVESQFSSKLFNWAKQSGSLPTLEQCGQNAGSFWCIIHRCLHAETCATRGESLWKEQAKTMGRQLLDNLIVDSSFPPRTGWLVLDSIILTRMESWTHAILGQSFHFSVQHVTVYFNNFITEVKVTGKCFKKITTLHFPNQFKSQIWLAWPRHWSHRETECTHEVRSREAVEEGCYGTQEGTVAMLLHIVDPPKDVHLIV